jgi:hypothetical protein
LCVELDDLEGALDQLVPLIDESVDTLFFDKARPSEPLLDSRPAGSGTPCKIGGSLR